MHREVIFGLIDGERREQDRRFGRAADLNHRPQDWGTILVRQLGLAFSDSDMPHDPERFRRQMIRVASVCVAALESEDE